MNTSPLRQSAAAKPDDTVDALKADLGRLAETVKTLAGEQLGAAAEQAQAKAVTTVNDLESAIRRSPTQAAAIAAGIGFVIGLVLTR